MHRTALPLAIAAVSLAITVASSAFAAAAADESQTAAVIGLRAATVQFQELSAAQAAGYDQLKDAAGIACIDKADAGGMGIHYVKGELVGDGLIDALRPEAVIYEPQPDGYMQLVGVEYVVMKSAWDASHSSPPSLFGTDFIQVGADNRYGLPPFYELHAWVWQHNQSGTFSDWNPRVSCADAPA